MKHMQSRTDLLLYQDFIDILLPITVLKLQS